MVMLQSPVVMLKPEATVLGATSKEVMEDMATIKEVAYYLTYFLILLLCTDFF